MEFLMKIIKVHLWSLFNSKNLGKGASLRRGFKEARGDIICIQDADLEYDPSDLTKMIDLILDGTADAVIGSRFRGNGPVRANLFINRVANFIITTLTNIFTNLSLTDIECCYKVFKKNDIQKINLKENRFGGYKCKLYFSLFAIWLAY